MFKLHRAIQLLRIFCMFIQLQTTHHAQLLDDKATIAASMVYFVTLLPKNLQKFPNKDTALVTIKPGKFSHMLCCCIMWLKKSSLHYPQCSRQLQTFIVLIYIDFSFKGRVNLAMTIVLEVKGDMLLWHCSIWLRRELYQCMQWYLDRWDVLQSKLYFVFSPRARDEFEHQRQRQQALKAIRLKVQCSLELEVLYSWQAPMLA